MGCSEDCSGSVTRHKKRYGYGVGGSEESGSGFKKGTKRPARSIRRSCDEKEESERWNGSAVEERKRVEWIRLGLIEEQKRGRIDESSQKVIASKLACCSPELRSITTAHHLFHHHLHPRAQTPSTLHNSQPLSPR